jgi:hypothetical protein
MLCHIIDMPTTVSASLWQMVQGLTSVAVAREHRSQTLFRERKQTNMLSEGASKFARGMSVKFKSNTVGAG